MINTESSDKILNKSQKQTSSPSLLNDPNYCKKVDEEYEAIKKTILSRTNPSQMDESSKKNNLENAEEVSRILNEALSRNFQHKDVASSSVSSRSSVIYEDPMNLSYYDNLDILMKEELSNKLVYEINSENLEGTRDIYHNKKTEEQEDEREEEEDTLNDSQLDDIIKHVNEAEELTKQLDEYDDNPNKDQTDFEIIEPPFNFEDTSNYSFNSDNLTVLSSTDNNNNDAVNVNLDSTLGTLFLPSFFK